MYIISKYQTFRLQFRFVFCSKACLNSKTKLCIQYMEIYIIYVYGNIVTLFYGPIYYNLRDLDEHTN